MHTIIITANQTSAAHMASKYSTTEQLNLKEKKHFYFKNTDS